MANNIRKSALRQSKEIPGPGEYQAYSEFGVYCREVKKVKSVRNS